MNKGLVFFLAVLCLFVGSMAVWFAAQAARRPVVVAGASEEKLDPQRKLEWFELTERNGKTFSSQSLLGEVWVANFFFARCPTVCWQQNQRMLQVEQEFGARGVKFVSITIDPENDNPSVLREYATRLGAGENWFFLTGNFDYIKKVGQDIFQVPVATREHSENLILVDRAGKLRGYYHWEADDQIADLKKELGKLLAKEPAAPSGAEKEA